MTICYNKLKFGLVVHQSDVRSDSDRSVGVERSDVTSDRQKALMSGFVYFLKSEVNGRYYIGSTNNVDRRLDQHNNGESKYTKLTKPFKLVFSQEYESLKKARQIEFKLKKLKRRDIIEKIIKEGHINLDL